MEDTLAVNARRVVLDELDRRLNALEHKQQDRVMRLSEFPADLDWIVKVSSVVVDVMPFVAEPMRAPGRSTSPMHWCAPIRM